MKLSGKSLQLAICLLSLFGWGTPAVFAQRQRPPKSRAPQRPASALSGELAQAITELLKRDSLAAEEVDTLARRIKQPERKDAQLQPPADEAPLKELLAFWQDTLVDSSSPKPSDRVRQRFLEACEERPWRLAQLLAWLPENSDAQERLYRLWQNAPDEEGDWKPRLREWLKYGSPYFLAELQAEARDAAQPIEDRLRALSALAKLDWETARPLLEASGHPSALGELHTQAVARGESALAESARARLLALLNDRRDEANRVLAFHSLLAVEWPGQEAWYISLFSNPAFNGAAALAEQQKWLEELTTDGNKAEELAFGKTYLAMSFTDDRSGNTQNLLAQGLPERLVATVAQLTTNQDRAVRNAAVETLVAFLEHNPTETPATLAAARALLPWLSDASWSDALARLICVRRLGELNLPESVPGLITLLDDESEPILQVGAAEALTKYRDRRAVPGLRRVLERETNEERRGLFTTALFECGGLTDEEAAAAIEAYARLWAVPGGIEALVQVREGKGELPLQISIGRIFEDSDTLIVTAGLAALLFERVKALRTKEPLVAQSILRIVEVAPWPVAYQFLAQRLGEGWLDTDALILFLQSRAALQKHAASELQAVLSRGGLAAGVAAVVLEDADAARFVLKSKDVQAQRALLACARFVEAALPVELVAELLAVPALMPVAEQYLRDFDHPAARQLVWARHAGEALILGKGLPANELRRNEPNQPGVLEARYKQEVLAPATAAKAPLQELYALLPRKNQDRWEIRVRGGQAELRKYEQQGEVRWRQRPLTASELAEWRTFVSRAELEELRAAEPLDGADLALFLQLTPQRGRRLVTVTPQPQPRNPTLHEELSALFYRFSHSGEFKVRYAIEEKIPGVEIVLADATQLLSAVALVGQELRVLTIATETLRNTNPQNWQPEWRVLVKGELGEVTDEPPGRPLRTLSEAQRKLERFGFQPGIQTAQSVERSGSFVGVIFGETPGVWRVLSGGEPEKLLEGRFNNPVLTPDGRWLIVSKESQTGPAQVVRYQLSTQAPPRETVVPLPKGAAVVPVAYLAAHGKVLLGSEHGRFQAEGQGWLLDPATGATQPVQGDFRPVMELAFLQPTGNPDEFWAALPAETPKSQGWATVIGRYDARKFSFQPGLTLPELAVDSKEIWVDEAGNRVWLVYQGHLLRLPLRATPR